MGACASRMSKHGVLEGVTPTDAPSTPKEDVVKPPTAAVTDTEKVSSGRVVVVEGEEADLKKCGNEGEGEKESGEVEVREKGEVEEKYEKQLKQDWNQDEGKRQSLSNLFQENDASEKPYLIDKGTKQEEVTTGLLQVKLSEAEEVLEKPLEDVNDKENQSICQLVRKPLDDADDKVEEKQYVRYKVSEVEQVAGKPLDDTDDKVEEKQSVCDEVSYLEKVAEKSLDDTDDKVEEKQSVCEQVLTVEKVAGKSLDDNDDKVEEKQSVCGEVLNVEKLVGKPLDDTDDKVEEVPLDDTDDKVEEKQSVCDEVSEVEKVVGKPLVEEKQSVCDEVPVVEKVVGKPLDDTDVKVEEIPLDDTDDKVEEKQSVCDEVSEVEKVVGEPLDDTDDKVEEKQSICDEVSEIENVVEKPCDDTDVKVEEKQSVCHEASEVEKLVGNSLYDVEDKVEEKQSVSDGVSEVDQVVGKAFDDAEDNVEENQSVSDEVSKVEQVVGKTLEDAEDNVEEKSVCEKVSEEVLVKVVEIENLAMSTQDKQAAKGEESTEVENKAVEVVSTKGENLTATESKVVERMPVFERIVDKPVLGGQTEEVEIEILESNQSLVDKKVCAEEKLSDPEMNNKVVDTETLVEVIKEQQVAEEPSVDACSTNEPNKELQVSEATTKVDEMKILEAEIIKELTQEEKPSKDKLTADADIKTENSVIQSRIQMSENTVNSDEPKILSVEEIKEEICTPKEEVKSTIVRSETANVTVQEANTVPVSEENQVVKDVKNNYDTSTEVVETSKTVETPAKDNC